MFRGSASEGDRVIEREKAINEVLQKPTVDCLLLRHLSRLKGGFVNSRMRQQVWPKLLGVNRYAIVDYRAFITISEADIPDVSVDIERSLWNWDMNKDWIDSKRDLRRKALSDIIRGILLKNRKELSYFQGFHDTVSVFLMVLDDDHLTFALSEVVANRYMSDYMKPDFETVAKMMRLLMVLISVADKKLFKFLTAAKMEPFFATSWLLTWFSHDLKDLNDIARIFDALLCSHPLFCFYVCAVVRNIYIQFI